MALHLQCQTCLTLWREYGAALGARRAKEALADERLEAAKAAIRAHEADGHVLSLDK
jgi:hypothetical protein